MAWVRRISVRAHFYNAASKATQLLNHFTASKTVSLLRILQKPLGQFSALLVWVLAVLSSCRALQAQFPALFPLHLPWAAQLSASTPQRHLLEALPCKQRIWLEISILERWDIRRHTHIFFCRNTNEKNNIFKVKGYEKKNTTVNMSLFEDKAMVQGCNKSKLSTRSNKTKHPRVRPVKNSACQL